MHQQKVRTQNSKLFAVYWGATLTFFCFILLFLTKPSNILFADNIQIGYGYILQYNQLHQFGEEKFYKTIILGEIEEFPRVIAKIIANYQRIAIREQCRLLLKLDPSLKNFNTCPEKFIITKKNFENLIDKEFYTYQFYMSEGEFLNELNCYYPATLTNIEIRNLLTFFLYDSENKSVEVYDMYVIDSIIHLVYHTPEEEKCYCDNLLEHKKVVNFLLININKLHIEMGKDKLLFLRLTDEELNFRLEAIKKKLALKIKTL